MRRERLVPLPLSVGLHVRVCGLDQRGAVLRFWEKANGHVWAEVRRASGVRWEFRRGFESGVRLSVRGE